MAFFKRDKLFEQFIPAIQKFKELPLPKDFPIVSGLVRVFQTDWENVDVMRTANELDLILLKDNEKASSYSKIEDKFDIIMIYNKNDKSIMIAISRAERKQKRRNKRRKL